MNLLVPCMEAATKLTKATLEKLSVEQTTLPKDVHTGIDILFKLFNRPQWKVFVLDWN